VAKAIAYFVREGFAGQGVLNKDSTIWIDGARPANTCLNVPAQPNGMPPPQSALLLCKVNNVCLDVSDEEEEVL
jgi:hypothetical protein